MFYGKSYTVLVDVQGGAGWHHPATVGVQQAPGDGSSKGMIFTAQIVSGPQCKVQDVSVPKMVVF